MSENAKKDKLSQYQRNIGYGQSSTGECQNPELDYNLYCYSQGYKNREKGYWKGVLRNKKIDSDLQNNKEWTRRFELEYEDDFQNLPNQSKEQNPTIYRTLVNESKVGWNHDNFQKFQKMQEQTKNRGGKKKEWKFSNGIKRTMDFPEVKIPNYDLALSNKKIIIKKNYQRQREQSEQKEEKENKTQIGKINTTCQRRNEKSYESYIPEKYSDIKIKSKKKESSNIKPIATLTPIRVQDNSETKNTINQKYKLDSVTQQTNASSGGMNTILAKVPSLKHLNVAKSTNKSHKYHRSQDELFYLGVSERIVDGDHLLDAIIENNKKYEKQRREEEMRYKNKQNISEDNKLHKQLLSLPQEERLEIDNKVYTFCPVHQKYFLKTQSKGDSTSYGLAMDTSGNIGLDQNSSELRNSMPLFKYQFLNTKQVCEKFWESIEKGQLPSSMFNDRNSLTISKLSNIVSPEKKSRIEGRNISKENTEISGSNSGYINYKIIKTRKPIN